MDTKQFLRDFLKRHPTMVLSTVTTQGKPESAVIEFGETEELELIFDTYTHFRKYANLKANTSVSCVIWSGEQTVQYEGQAAELQAGELESCKRIYFAKVPGAEKYGRDPDTRFFKITPKWIRFSDISAEPWKVFVVDF